LRLPNEIYQELAEDPASVAPHLQEALTRFIQELFVRRLGWALQRILGTEFQPRLPDEALHRSRGVDEFERLRFFKMADLEEKAQKGLRRALGEPAFEAHKDVPLDRLPQEVKERVILELGRQVLTEDWRILMLHVFNQTWADYLTQMEALRTAIRLEAYGQRDPLVEYKRKAYELYHQLLRDIRAQVIYNMFRYHVSESMIRLGLMARAAEQGEAAAMPKKPPVNAKSARNERRSANGNGKVGKIL